MIDKEKMHKRNAKWRKENMKRLPSMYFKNEFVDEYKEACKKLEIKQTEPIRKAMESTIKKASKL